MLSASVVLLHDNSRSHMAWRSIHQQEFSWEVFNIHPIACTSHPVISKFSYNTRNFCPVNFSKWQRGGDKCHTVVPISGSRLFRRGKWHTWCSGADRAFSLLTFWPEVRWWMLTVTVKHCRNCNGPTRTSSIGCLVHDNSRPHMAWWPIHQQEFSWEVFNIHPIARTSHPVISMFSYTTRNFCPVNFSKWQRGRDKCHTVVPIPGSKLLRYRDTKVGPTVWQTSQFQRWICWKIA